MEVQVVYAEKRSLLLYNMHLNLAADRFIKVR